VTLAIRVSQIILLIEVGVHGTIDEVLNKTQIEIEW
jgi:hypothetical protein